MYPIIPYASTYLVDTIPTGATPSRGHSSNRSLHERTTMTQHDQAPSWNIETLLVHGGRNRRANPAGSPTVNPIYASTTYVHGDVEDLDRAFSGKASDGSDAFVYQRHGNPSTSAFEQAVAQVEGGVGAVAFGSGMAAIHAALLSVG